MFLETIISNVPYIIITFLAITFLGWLLLIKLFPLNLRTWKKSDFIWLSLSFIGIVGVLMQNKKTFEERDLEKTNFRIEVLIRDILGELNQGRICFQYQKMSSSPENFDELQAESDAMCEWCKKTYPLIDSAFLREDYIDKTLFKMPKTVNSKDLLYVQNRCKKLFEDYNSQITNKNILVKSIQNDWKNSLFFMLSPILLTLGLAIRFLKTIAELKQTK